MTPTTPEDFGARAYHDGKRCDPMTDDVFLRSIGSVPWGEADPELRGWVRGWVRAEMAALIGLGR